MKNKYHFDDGMQKLRLTFTARTLEDLIRQLREALDQLEDLQGEESFEDEQEGFLSYIPEEEDSGIGDQRCNGWFHVCPNRR